MYDNVFERAEATFNVFKKFKAESRAGFLMDVAERIKSLGQILFKKASVDL